MAIKGMRVSEEFEYVSEKDDCHGMPIEDARQAGATIFRLGTLRVDIRTKIQDGVMGFAQDGNNSISMNMGRQYLEAVRFGLKGFENFSDDEGNPIEFKTEKLTRDGREYVVPTMETLGFFPTWLINELGKVVLGTNSVSGQERKNFNTQS